MDSGPALKAIFSGSAVPGRGGKVPGKPGKSPTAPPAEPPRIPVNGLFGGKSDPLPEERPPNRKDPVAAAVDVR